MLPAVVKKRSKITIIVLFIFFYSIFKTCNSSSGSNYCLHSLEYFQSSDVIDSERSSFLGFTREVPISLTSLELVDELQTAVFQQGRGDRRVRRYFDTYDTPFVGSTRRRMTYPLQSV